MRRPRRLFSACRADSAPSICSSKTPRSSRRGFATRPPYGTLAPFPFLFCWSSHERPTTHAACKARCAGLAGSLVRLGATAPRRSVLPRLPGRPGVASPRDHRNGTLAPFPFLFCWSSHERPTTHAACKARCAGLAGSLVRLGATVPRRSVLPRLPGRPGVASPRDHRNGTLALTSWFGSRRGSGHVVERLTRRAKVSPGLPCGGGASR
jgi:hypothetical protein